MASARDKLRSITIGRKIQFKTEIVVIDGEDFEVRAPSIRQRSRIIEAAGVTAGANKDEVAAKINGLELSLLAVIFLTYDPVSGQPVFEMTDKDSLAEMPAGSFVDTLALAAMRMLNIKNEGEEAPGKNSEAIPAESSSST